MIAGHTPSGTWRHTLDYGRITCLSCSVLTYNFALGKRKSLRILRVAIRRFFVYFLFDPAAPCSYSLPVSAAPAVPLAIPFFLAISAASSGFVPVCPGSVNFSLISLLTAVGSCSFIFAGVIGSLSLYGVKGSSFLPLSVPGAPSSYLSVLVSLLEVCICFRRSPSVLASLARVWISADVGSVSLSNLAITGFWNIVMMNLSYSLSHDYKLVSNPFNIPHINAIICSYVFVNYFCPFYINLLTSSFTFCTHSRLWCHKWHSM